MSSYPIIFGGGLDPDASRYFQRAGVTNSTAKTQLNNFVKGTKRLGLWNSMVCWPLRSSQNAGTGTTAYSLGGVGTYNGTLTNGPTWGSTGVSFTRASNQYIITPTLPVVSTPSCGFSVAYTSLTLAADRQNVWRMGGSANINDRGIFQEWPSYINGNEAGGFGSSLGGASIINSRHLALSGLSSISPTLGYYQSSTSGFELGPDTGGFNAVATPMTIGQWAGGGGSDFTGEVSLVMALIGVTPTSPLYSSMRTLLNSSLFSGLTLP